MARSVADIIDDVKKHKDPLAKRNAAYELADIIEYNILSSSNSFRGVLVDVVSVLIAIFQLCCDTDIIIRLVASDTLKLCISVVFDYEYSKLAPFYDDSLFSQIELFSKIWNLLVFDTDGLIQSDSCSFENVINHGKPLVSGKSSFLESEVIASGELRDSISTQRKIIRELAGGSSKDYMRIAIKESLVDKNIVESDVIPGEPVRLKAESIDTASMRSIASGISTSQSRRSRHPKNSQLTATSSDGITPYALVSLQNLLKHDDTISSSGIFEPINSASLDVSTSPASPNPMPSILSTLGVLLEDCMYRQFDQCWEVRHGCTLLIRTLLGSLLTNHQHSNFFSLFFETVSVLALPPQSSCGGTVGDFDGKCLFHAIRLLEDISLRSVLLLSLDRFSDFQRLRVSGPVREQAGFVLELSARAHSLFSTVSKYYLLHAQASHTTSSLAPSDVLYQAGLIEGGKVNEKRTISSDRVGEFGNTHTPTCSASNSLDLSKVMGSIRLLAGGKDDWHMRHAAATGANAILKALLSEKASIAPHVLIDCRRELLELRGVCADLASDANDAVAAVAMQALTLLVRHEAEKAFWTVLVYQNVLNRFSLAVVTESTDVSSLPLEALSLLDAIQTGLERSIRVVLAVENPSEAPKFLKTMEDSDSLIPLVHSIPPLVMQALELLLPFFLPMDSSAFESSGRATSEENLSDSIPKDLTVRFACSALTLLKAAVEFADSFCNGSVNVAISSALKPKRSAKSTRAKTRVEKAKNSVVDVRDAISQWMDRCGSALLLMSVLCVNFLLAPSILEHFSSDEASVVSISKSGVNHSTLAEIHLANGLSGGPALRVAAIAAFVRASSASSGPPQGIINQPFSQLADGRFLSLDCRLLLVSLGALCELLGLQKSLAVALGNYVLNVSFDLFSYADGDSAPFSALFTHVETRLPEEFVMVAQEGENDQNKELSSPALRRILHFSPLLRLLGAGALTAFADTAKVDFPIVLKLLRAAAQKFQYDPSEYIRDSEDSSLSTFLSKDRYYTEFCGVMLQCAAQYHQDAILPPNFQESLMTIIAGSGLPPLHVETLFQPGFFESLKFRPPVGDRWRGIALDRLVAHASVMKSNLLSLLQKEQFGDFVQPLLTTILHDLGGIIEGQMLGQRAKSVLDSCKKLVLLSDNRSSAEGRTSSKVLSGKRNISDASVVGSKSFMRIQRYLSSAMEELEEAVHLFEELSKGYIDSCRKSTIQAMLPFLLTEISIFSHILGRSTHEDAEHPTEEVESNLLDALFTAVSLLSYNDEFLSTAIATSSITKSLICISHARRISSRFIEAVANKIHSLESDWLDTPLSGEFESFDEYIKEDSFITARISILLALSSMFSSIAMLRDHSPPSDLSSSSGEEKGSIQTSIPLQDVLNPTSHIRFSWGNIYTDFLAGLDVLAAAIPLDFPSDQLQTSISSSTIFQALTHVSIFAIMEPLAALEATLSHIRSRACTGSNDLLPPDLLSLCVALLCVCGVSIPCFAPSFSPSETTSNVSASTANLSEAERGSTVISSAVYFSFLPIRNSRKPQNQPMVPVETLASLALPLVNDRSSVARARAGDALRLVLEDALQMTSIESVSILSQTSNDDNQSEKCDLGEVLEAHKRNGQLILRRLQLSALAQHARMPPSLRERVNANFLISNRSMSNSEYLANDYSLSFNAAMLDALPLFPYQREAVVWASFLESNGLGGILADEMGLGKTLQALAFIACAAVRAACTPCASRVSVMVAPSGLLRHWEGEISRYFDEIRVDNRPFFAVHNTQSATFFTDSKGDFSYSTDSRDRVRPEEPVHHILLISYYNKSLLEALGNMKTAHSAISAITGIDTTRRTPIQTLIVDEAHLLRNRASQLHQRVARLALPGLCWSKFLLTGTPIQNDPQELYVLLQLCVAPFAGDLPKKGVGRTPSVLSQVAPGGGMRKLRGFQDGEDALRRLQLRALPFVMRRLKSTLASQLPEKVVSDRLVELSSLQRLVYDRFLHSSGYSATFDGQQLEIVESEDVSDEVEGKQNSFSACSNGVKDNDPSSHVFSVIRTLRDICNDISLVNNAKVEEILKSIESTKGSTHHELICSSGEGGSSSDDISCVESSKLRELREILVEEGILNDSERTDAECSEEKFDSNNPTKVIIFSQSARVLDLIEKNLVSSESRNSVSSCKVDGGNPKRRRTSSQYSKMKSNKIDPNLFFRLDGSIPAQRRSDICARFAQSLGGVLLATTGVAGLGLNLSTANLVVFYDHSWNPIVDLQAQDRAHRIGQRRMVRVVRLISKNTIEEYILNLQKVKQFVAERVLPASIPSLNDSASDRPRAAGAYESATSASPVDVSAPSI